MLLFMSRATELFEIQTRLAIGDAALVYRAVDQSGRVVALKLLLNENQISYPLNVEALLRDAPQLQTITGVNIVQLLDAFPDEDGTVLVYECAEGHRGLDVPGKRPIDAGHAVDVAAQLLSALRSGERQRYPHGDLKPSDTVIVDLPDGRPLVMVLDWGLANYRRELTPESYAYTAPERLAGDPPSHTADLFSAGAVLHYLFTGKRLLPCKTPEEFAAAWPALDTHALAALRPDLPKALVDWIAKLLAPDAARRPASAVKALEELAALNPPLPPAVPERIRPKIVRAIPPPPPPAVPVSAVRQTPRASAVQARPQPAEAPDADTAKAIEAAKKEVARLARKRQALSLASIFLLLAACLGMAGYYVWKTKTGKLTAQSDEKVADMPSRDKVPDATPPPAATSPPPVAATPAPAAKLAQPIARVVPAAKPPAAAPVAPPAPAQTKGYIAVDGFEYPVGGKLAGLAGGTGWATPWVANFPDLALVEAGSVPFAKVPTVGEKVQLKPNLTPLVPGAPPTSKDVTLTRFLQPGAIVVDPKKQNIFFFRITVQHSDSPYGPESEFQFNAFDPSAIQKPIRVIVGDQGLGVEVSMHDRAKLARLPNSNKPLCIVQRFELTPEPGGKWTLTSRVFLNPNPESPSPPLHDLERVVKGVTLPQQFGVLIRKKSTPTTLIDEVRFAHRWVGLFQ